MLKASPTLLAPQLPPGMLRRGRAADKGRCGIAQLVTNLLAMQETGVRFPEKIPWRRKW